MKNILGVRVRRMVTNVDKGLNANLGRVVPCTSTWAPQALDLIPFGSIRHSQMPTGCVYYRSPDSTGRNT